MPCTVPPQRHDLACERADRDDSRPPNALLMLLEGRAPIEFFSLLAALPWLVALPRGDGHPVMVFPGMGASDVTTMPLRRFLRQPRLRHPGVGAGASTSARVPACIERCADDIRALAERHGQPVSLIGWSLGGIYARELAKLHPSATRCVVTLGTPFTGHPKATNAWRIYELLSGSKVGDAELMAQTQDAAAGADDVDLFAQRRRRRVALQPERAGAAGREHRGAGEPRRHGRRTRSSLYAVADRLAQPIGQLAAASTSRERAAASSARRTPTHRSRRPDARPHRCSSPPTASASRSRTTARRTASRSCWSWASACSCSAGTRTSSPAWSQRGFRVIRFDNRDIGLSQSFDDLRRAEPRARLAAPRARLVASRARTRSPTWPTTRSASSTRSASRRRMSAARRWAG